MAPVTLLPDGVKIRAPIIKPAMTPTAIPSMSISFTLEYITRVEDKKVYTTSNQSNVALRAMLGTTCSGGFPIPNGFGSADSIATMPMPNP